jgi:hypothetical protein
VYPSESLHRSLKLVGLVIFIALLNAGFGSRYSHQKCPGSQFPESKELLASGDFRGLKFFREGLGNLRNDLVDYEVWADGKFDFEACLMYHYPREGLETDDCVKGVTFQVLYPITEQRAKMGFDFLAFFENHLRGDLSVLRNGYSSCVKERELNRPYRQEIGNLVLEVCAVHQVTRGDFLVIGVYEKAYYRRTLEPS